MCWWKAEGIEEVKQQDICQHDRYEDDHDLIEHEHLRIEDAFSGHFHHTAGKVAQCYAQAGYDQNGSTGSYLGTDGWVWKLTASLLTPTIRSEMASMKRTTRNMI